jgi:uncharacterized membrane protein YidH (DUF202 family)
VLSAVEVGAKKAETQKIERQSFASFLCTFAPFASLRQIFGYGYATLRITHHELRKENTMTIVNFIDILLIGLGLFLVYVNLFKPDFYWNSRRIKMRRQYLGDRNTIVMYSIIGIIFILIGAWGLAIAG